ncbi:MAG: hypothetical protein B6D39_08845 [Anaerolineae bacterium UTCFX2]|jgi:FHS family Na+ dependent glucose MFS transporter 1|nr:MFS transporter [Anaerolineales bacterium]OQY89875.1 MAG: hypothetical protein B6D39_08845 [Anaerolineae bacterium UTCFX2]
MTTEPRPPKQANDYPAATQSTIAYFLTNIILGLTTAALGPALPNLSEQTGAQLGAIGLLFTAQNFGYMSGSLGFGNLLDRAPGNRLLTIILLTMSAMLGLIPLTASLALLMLIFFVLGMANGGLDVCGNPMLVWIYRDRANPVLNALHFFFGIGAFLAPLLVAQSLTMGWGIRGAFWLLALYPLPVALWLFRLPSPSSPKVDELVEHQPTPWLLVILIAVVYAFYVGAELGFGGWIYTFAINQGLAGTTGAAYLNSLFWGALTVGRLISVGIATRVRPAIMLMVDFIGCLASLGLIWSAPGSVTVVWIGTILLGLFMASVFPTLLAFAGRHMTLSGATSRWFFVGTGLGGMTLPWVLGELIERHGPEAMIPALFLTIALVLLIFSGTTIVAAKK